MRKNDTKSLMKKALVDLLCKKKFLEITVTDVVNKANVARASFYRSYSSIDQILDDIFNELKIKIHTTVFPLVFNGTDEMRQNALKELFTLIRDKDIVFADFLPDNVSLLTSRFEKELSSWNQNNNKISYKYTPLVNLTIIITVLKIWIKSNYKESPEELAEYTYGLIKLHRVY
jgi:AcrR family transcriptional regulator